MYVTAVFFLNPSLGIDGAIPVMGEVGLLGRLVDVFVRDCGR